MKIPKQIIIPNYLYEPSIEDRINEMKIFDKIEKDANYSNKQYKEFATEEYLTNHEDYIKLKEDIHKKCLEHIRIELMDYEELLHQLAEENNTTINPCKKTKIEKLLTYIHYLQQ